MCDKQFLIIASCHMKEIAWFTFHKTNDNVCIAVLTPSYSLVRSKIENTAMVACLFVEIGPEIICLIINFI